MLDGKYNHSIFMSDEGNSIHPDLTFCGKYISDAHIEKHIKNCDVCKEEIKRINKLIAEINAIVLR